MEEMPPPWDIFDESYVYEHSIGEAYITRKWLSYWESLSAPAQEAYLDQWHAPDKWRGAIAKRYNPTLSDTHPETDSIPWFDEYALAAAPSQGWLHNFKSLFRKKKF